MDDITKKNRGNEATENMGRGCSRGRQSEWRR